MKIFKKMLFIGGILSLSGCTLPVKPPKLRLRPDQIQSPCYLRAQTRLDLTIPQIREIYMADAPNRAIEAAEMEETEVTTVDRFNLNNDPKGRKIYRKEKTLRAKDPIRSYFTASPDQTSAVIWWAIPRTDRHDKTQSLIRFTENGRGQTDVSLYWISDAGEAKARKMLYLLGCGLF